MSLRLISHRLFKHGRYFLQNCFRRNIHLNILEQEKKNRLSIGLRKPGQIANQYPAVKNLGILRFGQDARRLFVDNILYRVTPTYSSDIRNEVNKKFFYGDSTPFFALVGISLASGNGILTKDDELEGVCYEIRDAVTRLQKHWHKAELPTTVNSNFGLDELDIGPPIAKGCSAVVYAASLKPCNDSVPETDVTITDTSSPSQVNRSGSLSGQFDTLSSSFDQNSSSRFLHNFGGSADNLYFNRSLNDNLNTSPIRLQNFTVSKRQRFESISEIEDNTKIEVEQTSVLNNNELKGSKSESVDADKQKTSIALDSDILQYPFALKMMFNYDIQSNAMAILRAMYKETIPARNKQFLETADSWEKLLMEQACDLPAHPNIVAMYGVFCAQIPNLSMSKTLYPMALPPRINPDGYGRNMSLFLFMKRYHCSLCEYLQNSMITMRTRILLFTQLLEAIAHLYRYGISHRDLKSDNILIDLNDDVHPMLILSDFGCCLADKSNGFNLPYKSMDIDKGGNTALMAPEIITKTPGTFSVLNYTKSDLWACGTIGYEIFNQKNPFYTDGKNDGIIRKSLRNVNYAENELPTFNNDVPVIVQKLIGNILQRNPNKRLQPDVAANVMQLFLWAPSKWFHYETNPTNTEILQWLLSLTTKIFCESKFGNPTVNTSTAGYQITGRRTYTEYLLISTFLMRSNLQRIRCALNWMQNIIV